MKKSKHESPQSVVAIQKNRSVKVVYKKKRSFNINYGIVTNTFILITIIIFTFICYTIDPILVNPLVMIGVILIMVLFSIFNLLSILEKERDNTNKNNKLQDKKEGC